MFKNKKDILAKVKNHGIWGIFVIVVRKFLFYAKYKSPWALHPAAYYRLIKMLFCPHFNKKRILGIWDFKSLPWSVGDPLVFIEKLSTLKIERNVEEIDICIIYDHDDPNGNRKPGGIHKFESNLTPENAQDYMLEFLPLFSTCPYLGSIFQFNLRSEFYYFLKNNYQRYNIYPPLGKNLAETYNFRGGEPHVSEIQEFYNIHGFIPFLRIGNRDSSWARWFYLNKLPEKTVPVALSIKRTSHATDRNTDPNAWLSFLDKCKIEFPEVTFVFIGLREEAFNDLRKRTNVIIAKDYGTSIIEDFALIRTSIMYMGAASGVNAIALFSDLPYLIFRSPNVRKYGLTSGKGFSFSTEKQKTFGTEVLVTGDFLFDEFRKLYMNLDRNKWFNITIEGSSEKNGLPAAKV